MTAESVTDGQRFMRTRLKAELDRARKVVDGLEHAVEQVRRDRTLSAIGKAERIANLYAKAAEEFEAADVAYVAKWNGTVDQLRAAAFGAGSDNQAVIDSFGRHRAEADSIDDVETFQIAMSAAMRDGNQLRLRALAASAFERAQRTPPELRGRWATLVNEVCELPGWTAFDTATTILDSITGNDLAAEMLAASDIAALRGALALDRFPEVGQHAAGRISWDPETQARAELHEMTLHAPPPPVTGSVG